MQIAKFITFAFFLFPIHNVYCQIIWNESIQIVWTDFKGPKPAVSKLKALTVTSIDYSYFISDSCIQYDVKAVFFQSDSWTSDTSKYLLEHEVLHFTIAEIYARKIREYLSAAKNKEQCTIEKAIRVLIQKMHEYQKSYDKQTNHSLKVLEQKQWNAEVKKEFNKLNTFTNSRFISNQCPN